MLDTLYAEKRDPVVPVRSGAPDIIGRIRSGKRGGKPNRETVGTALKSRIERLITIKTGTSCKCKDLATQMDGWGIAGCELRRDEIIGHLVANRDILTAALRGHQGIIAHSGGVLLAMLPDSILAIGAGVLLSEAIADVRNQRASQKRHRTVKQKATETKPPARFVFTPNPAWTSQVRHLTFHIWATKTHDGWKWNLRELAKRWSLFNGVKVMAVALSDESETAATIVAYASSLGIAFDHVIGIQNNKKLREVVTWTPMLEFLNPEYAGHNEVVFSCHAKGVRHSALTSTLETWARIMYEACLDDWTTVDDQLIKYLATGAFKRYNNFRTPGNDCWHYSGTFFWWRLRELGQRDWRRIDQKFYGTESWLGLHCKNEETGCLFTDETGNLYDANYMTALEQQWKAQYEHK